MRSRRASIAFDEIMVPTAQRAKILRPAKQSPASSGEVMQVDPVASMPGTVAAGEFAARVLPQVPLAEDAIERQFGGPLRRDSPQRMVAPESSAAAYHASTYHTSGP